MYFYKGGIRILTSKYNEKQKDYTIKYIKENYDEIKLRLPKGFKNNLKQHIENMFFSHY